eukprot:gene3944-7154_t
MGVKLRGSLNIQRFYDIPKRLLSNKHNQDTWKQFKVDEPMAYYSLVLGLTVVPLAPLYSYVSDYFGWSVKFEKSPTRKQKYYFDKDLGTFDFSHEARHHNDDEGIEYEYVYSDGTKEVKKC